MSKYNRLLVKYLAKIAQHTKTIEEIMEEQDRPTVPAPESKDEKKLYEELLKLLKDEEKKK